MGGKKDTTHPAGTFHSGPLNMAFFTTAEYTTNPNFTSLVAVL